MRVRAVDYMRGNAADFKGFFAGNEFDRYTPALLSPGDATATPTQ